MQQIVPKIDTKFFISWLACAVAMFGVSYVWHGIVLNDLMRISYPLDIFLTIAGLVYLGIGFIITVLTYVLKKIKDSFKYGMAVGAALGVFIYAIAFLLGISFYTVVDFKMIAFDLGWQVFEQAFGGLVCGWFYRFLYVREKHTRVSA